ncbi:MAG: Peptidase [Firmicutes bacterium]|nr:Peptidase [Bacillota bacterium]
MLRLKRKLSLGLSILLLFTAVSSVLAEESQEAKDKLENVRKQMEQQKSAVTQAQQQVDSAAEQLHRIQVNWDNAIEACNQLKVKRAEVDKQMEANSAVLTKTEAALKKRSDILNKRVRDIYKNGQISYIDVLFGASDFSDFTNRLDIIKRVISHDVALFAAVKAENDAVLATRAELESERAAVVELEKAIAEQKKIIEASKKEREAVLKSVTDNRDTAEKAYQDLVATSKDIEARLQQSQYASQAVGSTGAMMWPVSGGTVTSPFGWRTHPVFGTARFHSGIDIGVDYGTPVRAADGGVVVTAGWMSGYGYGVIIDHGSGISTVYGHNSELLVSEGQRVAKGQQIARAGSTGYSTGPHCHFEVRKNGSPVSPLSYLH